LDLPKNLGLVGDGFTENLNKLGLAWEAVMVAPSSPCKAVEAADFDLAMVSS
jgi:hypothetical protein